MVDRSIFVYQFYITTRSILRHNPTHTFLFLFYDGRNIEYARDVHIKFIVVSYRLVPLCLTLYWTTAASTVPETFPSSTTGNVKVSLSHSTKQPSRRSSFFVSQKEITVNTTAEPSRSEVHARMCAARSTAD